MNKHDAIVIGAGNGGLTAALTLARKGRKVLLLERHNVPGGCATSFCRGRFEFEVALHQLSSMGTESNPGPLRGMFQHLGILDKLDVVIGKTMYRIIVPGSLDIALPADRQGTIDVLKERFPAEKDAIERFFGLVYQLCLEWVNIFVLKDPEASKAKYPLFFEYRLKESASVLDKFFQDPLLKMALGIYWLYIGQPPSRLSFFDLALILFIFLEFKPAHLKGGSQALSNALLETFLEKGGEARFNCGVKRILTKNGRIRGIITENGEEILCDYIISNAGTFTTYVDLLSPEDTPTTELQSLGTQTIGPSAFTLYIGLDCEAAALGIKQGANFICTDPDMEGQYNHMKTLDGPGATMFSCYDVDDPDFSPAGCCQIAFVTLQYADPWIAIPPSQYEEVKNRYAEKMMSLLDKVIPGYRDHIEEMEVATPLTHMRYLHHPGGAIYGADQSFKDADIFLSPVSSIKGLYFSGAWVTTGGFHPTLSSGIEAAELVWQELSEGVK
jgi:phytoene dehydrogenase-like protein